MRVCLVVILLLLVPPACNGAELIRHCRPTTQSKANMGRTAAIGKGFVAFGARRLDPASTGAVFVYDGPGFARETKLQASDASPNSDFGESVAAHDSILVVGAQRAEHGRGAAYVFQKQPRGFVEVAKLVASDRSPNDHFGWSCSIDDGVIVIGAVHAGQSGAAYVFETRRGGKWAQTARLAPESLPENAEFGMSCGVSGNSIIVGGRQLAGAGVAYVFAKERRDWSEGTRLDPGGLSPGDRYGHAVAISGNTAVVTAAWDDNVADDSGAVYVWRGDPSWQMAKKLKDSEARMGGRFGYSVSLHGDTMLVGSPQYAVGGEKGAGMGHVYMLTGEECSTLR